MCLALLAISFLGIKCIFPQENRRSLLWVMLFCINVFWRYQLELSQKALDENIIEYLGRGCGKTHIAVLLIHKLGHLIRKPQRNICVFFGPTVVLFWQVSYNLSCLFCNLMFDFWYYLSLRHFFKLIWQEHCTTMKWCAFWLGWSGRCVGCEKGVGLLVFSVYVCNFSSWF